VRGDSKIQVDGLSGNGDGQEALAIEALAEESLNNQ
jgi:hypothetical protein